MTCLEVQEILPDLLDVPVDGSLPSGFQSHLKGCSDCSELVSDLRSITSEAPQLAAAHEPSPLLWLRIAAQLRSEGLIREEDPATDRSTYRPSLVRTSPRPRWSLSWLVPVAAVLLVAGTYLVKHQPSQQASNQLPQAATAPVNAAPPAGATEAAAAPAQSVDVAASLVGAKKPASDASVVAHNRPSSEPTIESAPSDDEQFLSVVSTRAPAMRTTYEKQLQTVNADISETQAYVDQNPGDADAREHLMDAYQQKALLYQIALDRIQ